MQKRIISSENLISKKPKSQGSFSSLPLDKTLVNTLENDMKYTSMTLVQEMTVEILLSGKDLHVLSRTGSGKTAAFLVPSIQRLITQAPQSVNKIKLLCISPTRELALQIAKEAELMTKKLNFRVGVAIGGTNIRTEERAIISGIDILIATPGRLLDHLSKTQNLLSNVSILVLDECDRLLDMGFGPDVNKIMGFSPKERQSILCSATTSQAINSIVSTLLKPSHETVSTIPKGESNVHERIPQHYYEADFEYHIDLVVTLIQQNYSPTFKAVVFCQTAHLANLVHAVLSKCSLFAKTRNCFVQHSRQSQGARTKVTQQFKDCTVGILVATDVVARGMDFPLVSHVFQIGVDSTETYVHRVGRTGRNGAEGTGFLILAPQERYLVPLLQKRNIPLKTGSIEIVSYPFIVEAVAVFCRDSENAKKVYQSWIGYYNSQRGMKLDKATLIALAQNFARHVLGCSEPPVLERKVISKMGLAAYASILCGQGQAGRSADGKGKIQNQSLRVSVASSNSRSIPTGLSPSFSRASIRDSREKSSATRGRTKKSAKSVLPTQGPVIPQNATKKVGKSGFNLVLKPKSGVSEGPEKVAR